MLDQSDAERTVDESQSLVKHVLPIAIVMIVVLLISSTQIIRAMSEGDAEERMKFKMIVANTIWLVGSIVLVWIESKRTTDI